MKIKKIGTFIFAVLFIGRAYSQQPTKDYLAIYTELCNQDDESKTIAHLEKWEEEKPNDPEMFISGFNFYLQKSKNEIIRLDDAAGQGKGLQIMDSINSEPVGYLYGDVLYDEDLFTKSIDYLTRGLVKNPSRLDMHFGKIYSLGQRDMFEEQTTNILSLLDYGKSIDHKWLWKLGEPLEDGIEVEKGGVQNYVYEMFNQQIPACEFISTISIKLIEIYPDDVFGYSNLGACDLMDDNYKQAIKWFKKAEKIDSQDLIVLSNIAYAYMNIDKKKEAIKYYEKVAAIGDEEYKEFALQKMKELKE